MSHGDYRHRCYCCHQFAMVVLRRDNRVCIRLSAKRDIEVKFLPEKYWQEKDGEGLQPGGQPLHQEVPSGDYW